MVVREVEEWWLGLSDDRKVQIYRWLVKQPLLGDHPDQICLIDVEGVDCGG